MPTTLHFQQRRTYQRVRAGIFVMYTKPAILPFAGYGDVFMMAVAALTSTDGGHLAPRLVPPLLQMVRSSGDVIRNMAYSLLGSAAQT